MTNALEQIKEIESFVAALKEGEAGLRPPIVDKEFGALYTAEQVVIEDCLIKLEQALAIIKELQLEAGLAKLVNQKVYSRRLLESVNAELKKQLARAKGKKNKEAQELLERLKEKIQYSDPLIYKNTVQLLKDCQAFIEKIGSEKVQKRCENEPIDGWQPIETAPRDETSILLFDGNVGIGCWFEYTTFEGQEICRWLWDGEGLECENPTHWQPLPKPPINKE